MFMTVLSPGNEDKYVRILSSRDLSTTTYVGKCAFCGKTIVDNYESRRCSPYIHVHADTLTDGLFLSKRGETLVERNYRTFEKIALFRAGASGGVQSVAYKLYFP